jgi:hypothetical protein
MRGEWVDGEEERIQLQEKKESRAVTTFNLMANQNLKYYTVSMSGNLRALKTGNGSAQSEERGMPDIIVREESAQAAIDYLSTGRAWSQLKRNGWEFRDYTKFVDSGRLRAKELGTTLTAAQREDNQILE